MVTGLSYVALCVPDVKQATDYYRRVLGLQVVGEGRLVARPDDFVRLAPHELVLKPGQPALERVAFEVDSFDGLPDGEWVDGEYTVSGPDGWTFSFIQPRPGVLRRGGNPPFNLTRLGHVNFWSPNPRAFVDWFVTKLGFRISEQLDEDWFWLRCTRDHHTLAIASAPQSAVHHIAFELAGWPEMLRACDHFRAEGQPVEFGPGRHGVGNNLFIYMIDPWGIRHEFFCDQARIDDESTYQSVVQRVDPTASVNRWGTAAPPSFFSYALLQSSGRTSSEGGDA